MSTGLVETIKRVALDAVDNAQMCDLRYGTVISVSPLKVQITNQLTIPESLLVVPRRLTNHTVDISVNLSTENASGGENEASFESHSHDINTQTRVLFYNALKVGERVALLRQQGGQSYFILDRI